MKQNPLERQTIEKANLLKRMREKYGDMFDEREEIKGRIEGYILQLDTFEKEGLVFNKEEVIKGLKQSLEIKDKKEFIAHLMRVLEPMVMAKFTQPGIFEKVERDVDLNGSDDNIRLSEVLSCELKLEDGMVKIHLAFAKELIKGEGIGYFKKEVEIGLKKLADEIVSPNNKIKKVLAESWIVAKNPLLLERLGFIYDGMVPEEEDDAMYVDDLGNKKRTARAFMVREDFLARYGSKKKID